MRLFRRRRQNESKADQVAEAEAKPPVLVEIPLERTYNEHLDYLLKVVDSLPPFGMSLLEATGLSSCEDIVAEHGLPLLDSAAISGFAVAASDVADVTKDSPLEIGIDTGDGDLAFEKIRPIRAGEVLPVGADAVLAPEQVKVREKRSTVISSVDPGENVRPAGSDIGVGMKLMQRGQKLDPATVGVLASVGIDRVLVRPRPRVVIISAGDHLVDPGLALERDDQNWESTSLMIAAAARDAGAHVFRVPVLTNDIERIKQTISDQLIRADLVITVGGVVSEQPAAAAQVIGGLGQTHISDVSMDPGTRHGVGLLGDDEVPALLLPGDPSAAFVAFHAFVRPVIRKLMGSQPYRRPEVRCISSTVIRSDPGRRTFTLGKVVSEGGRRVVTPVGSAQQPKMSNLTVANALILMDEDTVAIKGGQAVKCWMLEEE